MAYLKFISDENLIKHIGEVIFEISKAEREANEKLHKNVIDPFSALFDGIAHSIEYENWLNIEKVRQAQKTMQNAIGDFHQNIIGSIYDWENLGINGGLDVICKKKKIIAEIKNKFNTTKGNHKVELYDAIKTMLNDKKYKDYRGFVVHIIPKSKKEYNKLFTPPDAKIKKRRPENENIRVIDGKSFYTLATGRKQALKELFESIPIVIFDNFSKNLPNKLSKKEVSKYIKLFSLAYTI